MFDIRVKLMNNQTLDLSLEENQKLIDLKNVLQERLNISCDKMRIIHNGRVLKNDSDDLNLYCKSDQSTVFHLVVRPANQGVNPHVSTASDPSTSNRDNMSQAAPPNFPPNFTSIPVPPELSNIANIMVGSFNVDEDIPESVLSSIPQMLSSVLGHRNINPITNEMNTPLQQSLNGNISSSTTNNNNTSSRHASQPPTQPLPNTASYNNHFSVNNNNNDSTFGSSFRFVPQQFGGNQQQGFVSTSSFFPLNLETCLNYVRTIQRFVGLQESSTFTAFNPSSCPEISLSLVLSELSSVMNALQVVTLKLSQDLSSYSANSGSNENTNNLRMSINAQILQTQMHFQLLTNLSQFLSLSLTSFQIQDRFQHSPSFFGPPSGSFARFPDVSNHIPPPQNVIGNSQISSTASINPSPSFQHTPQEQASHNAPTPNISSHQIHVTVNRRNQPGNVQNTATNTTLSSERNTQTLNNTNSQIRGNQGHGSPPPIPVQQALGALGNILGNIFGDIASGRAQSVQLNPQSFPSGPLDQDNRQVGNNSSNSNLLDQSHQETQSVTGAENPSTPVVDDVDEGEYVPNNNNLSSSEFVIDNMDVDDLLNNS